MVFSLRNFIRTCSVLLVVRCVAECQLHEIEQMLATCHHHSLMHAYDDLSLQDSVYVHEVIRLARAHEQDFLPEYRQVLDQLSEWESAWSDDLLLDPIYRVPPTPTDLVKVVGGIGFKAPGGNTVVMSPALDTDPWTFQLPPNAGDPGDVLTTDGTGVITWQAGFSGSCEIVSTCTYFAIEIPDGPDTYELVMQPDTNIQPSFELAVAGSVPHISLELLIKGSGAFYAVSDIAETDAVFFTGPNVAGNSRGVNAVDLQLTRTSAEYVASGAYSVLVGGASNQATGPAAAAIAGIFNQAQGIASGTFAGVGNIIIGAPFDVAASVAVGGSANTVTSVSAGIFAGVNNTVNDQGSVILGGTRNLVAAVATRSAVVGGDGNTVGDGITAIDYSAVVAGSRNFVSASNSVAVGGFRNTASGLQSITLAGDDNQAVGENAIAGGLSSTAVGVCSVALGNAANAANDGSFVFADNTGSGYTSTADNTFNVYATNGVFMPVGVTGVTVTGAPVLIDATTGQLGTVSSARRYKENIKAMPSEYSARIFALQPVTFNYKKTPEIESFGLIAEDVLDQFPELVVKNKDGDVETVKYYELPVLLLNELIEQRAMIRDLQERICKLSHK